QPGGQDAAAGDHQGRADVRGHALPGARCRQADLQDADRRQRQPRVLHEPRDRDVHQRGRRDARRGDPRPLDRAGQLAGRLPGAGAISLRDLGERMLFVEAMEAVRCLDEGVIESVADANIGSILGIGFPGWTGGDLQYINGYDGGLPGFVVRARELAARYGERFEPPASLVEKAERGETYTDEATLVPA